MDYDFDSNRKIIHVDMDAFYASVEENDAPELIGKPIAVGGGSERGVVAAASYAARKFGVRSAMSGALARRLCPDLIFVTPRFERYNEVSKMIREVFFEYTDLVEPLSLDEAYLDVTTNRFELPSATLIAEEIRKKIKARTGLTASAGISINKFLAKTASDWNKPNGQKTIPPEEVLSFLETLDVKKFHGIGKKTKEKMYQLGIYLGSDLKNKSQEYLTTHFGKSGLYYFNVVRGIHKSSVKPFRIPKSLGAERTFSTNLTSELFLIEKLETLAAVVEERLHKKKLSGKTITLKIKYSDFKQHTRSKTLELYISNKELLLEHAKELLFKEKISNSVRLLGLSLSNLNTKKDPIKKVLVSKIKPQLTFPF